MKNIQEGVVRLHHYGPLRNILLGAGLAYAAQKEKYWHFPIAFVFPSVYAGYHVYKQRDVLRSEAVAFAKELR
jgi:hypothetical protein